MKPDDILCIYNYLRADTDKPDFFEERLADLDDGWDDPVECLLYLPIYSMGPGTITPRINYLRENDWGVERLAGLNDRTIVELFDSQVGTGTRFGLNKNFPKTIQRARQMQAYGIEGLYGDLIAKPDWKPRELFRTMSMLQRFEGVGIASALHVLMELGWDVVKPDRHICRFLSRLGGVWDQYFPGAGADQFHREGLLFFLDEWRSACGKFADFDIDGQDPEKLLVSKLTSRQIDRIIMWYTQDIARTDMHWRPKPICGKNPQCRKCAIQSCEYRQT